MGRRVVHDMQRVGLFQPYTPSRRDRPANIEAPWVPLRAADPASRFVAYLHQEVVDSLMEAAQNSADGDSIGWLLGRGFLDSDGPYSFVRWVINASAPERDSGSIRTSSSDDERYSQLIHTTYPHLDPVGWWRSTDDPSAADATADHPANHKRWCTADHQLGLRVVHDGRTTAIFGVYGSNAAPLAPLRSGLEVVDPPRAMVVASTVKRSKKRVVARPAVRTEEASRPPRWRRAVKALREFFGGFLGTRDG